MLSEDYQNKFKSLIQERCGLYFKDHHINDLQKIINQRTHLSGCSSHEEYFNFLVSSPLREDEYRELINCITIKHTYFFRNTPHFHILEEKVLPELIQKKMSSSSLPTLRIWSAGCSTGEEPYSIAITLKEILPNTDGWDIYILATDASTQALEKARKGIYEKRSIKNVHPEYRQKYFWESKDQYRIHDKIRQMVTFEELNLVTDPYPKYFDIIFCRNVTIYFDFPTTIKVLHGLHSSLVDNGSIFIGYSETLQFMSDEFRMQEYRDGIFYQKMAKSPIPSIETSITANVEKKITKIAHTEAKTRIKTTKNKGSENIIADIIKAIHMKQYDKALFLIKQAQKETPLTIDPYYLEAEIYANKRDFHHALRQLEIILNIDNFFAPAYYLMGCIELENTDLELAQQHFKKALYLSPDFILANFNLANIYKEEGFLDHAIRLYRNTLKDLRNTSPDTIIPYSHGINTATLLTICKDNLERLKLQKEEN